MIRLLRRSPGGLPALRVWFDGDWPVGRGQADGIAVEWAGQVGHPSSYALLGGALAAEHAICVETDGPLFDDSLAGSGDVVRFGLPAEYREVVGRVADRDGRPLAILIAAQGECGSSLVACSPAASFLVALANGAGRLRDDELWTTWQQASESASSPLT